MINIAEWINDAVGRLLAGYANQTREWSPEKFRDYTIALAPLFAEHPDTVVDAAIASLHAEAKWVPVVYEVREHLNARRREHQAKAPALKRPEQMLLEQSTAPPAGTMAAEEYVRGAETVYEAIARQWECENRAGITPEQKKERARAVQAFIDGRKGWPWAT